jgi:hypothetical protein
LGDAQRFLKRSIGLYIMFAGNCDLSLENPQEGQAKFNDAPHSAQNRLSFLFSA